MNKPKQIQDKESSKFLSYILRHQPEAIALHLDSEGWANIDQLILQAQHIAKRHFNLEQIQDLVVSNDKQRFEISADGLHIRAVQGHSHQAVDRSFEAKLPPDVLYHGTATRFIDSILAEGLTPQQRQYVHLSEQLATATQVGSRYGKVKVLTIDSAKMHAQGDVFYQAENGVWLVKHVPVAFISER
ncbi:putative RNA 2'-phosphotransferase [Acinetobacter calcoaceticus]|uniref:Probable RNA 2'-phosphotransferase n=1 Tax=Acinetobacter calcoaceticus TaxID=471 RepID=A0A4R1XZW1_ACICA|nr:putative RNA 2'-phosphotransferase [Acinetobacter calcoaceticus]